MAGRAGAGATWAAAADLTTYVRLQLSCPLSGVQDLSLLVTRFNLFDDGEEHVVKYDRKVASHQAEPCIDRWYPLLTRIGTGTNKANRGPHSPAVHRHDPSMHGVDCLAFARRNRPSTYSQALVASFVLEDGPGFRKNAVLAKQDRQQRPQLGAATGAAAGVCWCCGWY